jgi:hypothetical protein
MRFGSLPQLQSAIGYRRWTRRLYRCYLLFFAHTISHILSVLFKSLSGGVRAVYRQTYLAAGAVILSRNNMSPFLRLASA